MPLYTIVLPTYNEVDNICQTLEILAECLKDVEYEVIVVDDNSPDGTFGKAVEYSMQHSNVEVVKRAGKMGLGSAYKYALSFARGDFIILMDADMSHHPKYIKDFIKTQNESCADIVNGSRYMSKGGVEGWSRRRYVISFIANQLASFCLGCSATDTTGSFRLYKTKILRNLLKYVRSHGYAFQVEVMALAQRGGCKIIDVPIIFKDREKGKSKLNFQEYVLFIQMMCRMMLNKYLKIW